MELDEGLGPLADEAATVLDDLAGRDAVGRLLARDHTLWADDPTEIADRLGWLDCPGSMRAEVPRLLEFADECGADGLERAVVLGMGGSSLFPEVLDRTFGSRPDRLDLEVLDTTDPAAVGRVTADWPPARTLFLAASKSGSTIETRSHVERFWAEHPEPGSFAATTDPGSDLSTLAVERGFRATFENPPDIGGRYSALSLFGLVPAVLAGVSVDGLLDGAADLLAGDLAAAVDANLAARLAAAMAAGARTGRDKLTFVLDHRIATFGLWVEQLIAESTGKRGTGVLPVVGEALGTPDAYGDDRLFVVIGDPGDDDRDGLDVLEAEGHPVLRLGFGVEGADLVVDLGAQVLLWEAATALCGAALRINPFDQPDVAAAKAATQKVLDAGTAPVVPEQPASAVLAQVVAGDYVAIQAYVDPASEAVQDLEQVRLAIRDRLGVATTFGLGPRFLHSTGQFHKGGPPRGVFLQVVGDDPVDLDIPGAPYTFSTLKQAQAAGDLETLRSRGLRAARVTLDDLTGWEAQG
ncbi:MAG: glucose-6-phosphate isomerase [Acidimicrobiia bacterium]|nr:glucose-6-phosphate isomerase [Acidimicrobiia bacterium]